MCGAGAETPAARRPFWFDVQVDDASRPGSRDFETVVGAVDADLAEPERVHEERFLLARIAHRQDRSEEAARADVPGDLRSGPRIPRVAALLDHLEEQAGWMPGTQVLRAETLLHAAVVGVVPIEVLLPERNRPGRNGIAGAG